MLGEIGLNSPSPGARGPPRAAEYSKPTIGGGLTDFGWSLPYTTVGRGVNQLFDPYAGLGDNRAPGEGLFNPISPTIDPRLGPRGGEMRPTWATSNR